MAREDFGLNGIEFVNTLFEVPTEGYLKKLKQNAATHGVTMVLIMCDDEGDGARIQKTAGNNLTSITGNGSISLITSAVTPSAPIAAVPKCK